MADRSLVAGLGGIAALLAVAFGAFFTLDERHAHQHDVDAAELHQDASLLRRMLMSESTRYAEIEKYYTDELKAGQTLTEAQLNRLDLVQRQQQRIAELLKQ